MGTSQSHKLLKKPSWSKAKKAMTDVVKIPVNLIFKDGPPHFQMRLHPAQPAQEEALAPLELE